MRTRQQSLGSSPEVQWGNVHLGKDKLNEDIVVPLESQLKLSDEIKRLRNTEAADANVRACR